MNKKTSQSIAVMEEALAAVIVRVYMLQPENDDEI